ncbi:MAG: major capsid protein, partial [Shewanella sp.]
PGDTFHLSTQALARLSTPIVPIMDNVKLDVHYFSVPCRLVWDNWQRFMGERKNPSDSVDFLVPTINSGETGFGFYSIADMMGIPPNVPNLEVNALPFRAYWLIYNEWFRDQNLMDAVDIDLSDASRVVRESDARFADGHSAMGHRCKRHDYFTSCLPWPQKGEGVELPLGVPEISYNRAMTLTDDVGFLSPMTAAVGGDLWTSEQMQHDVALRFADAGFDLSPSSALTINTLRQAFQMQKMLERDARGGSRYVEIIRSHFGVISPDARLQRPEYLGMSSFDINVNPVVQNSATNEVSPQGNLAAYGVGGGAQHGFSHSFVEHCYVIGIASVRQDQTYQYGVERLWNRRTRFDFYWPSLSHLGEQGVLNKEIYATGTAADEEVFGYQERYAEYRYKPNRVSGFMRSSSPQPLDVWHLAQKFDSAPALTSEFIVETSTTLDRCLAVQNEPQFIGDFHFNLKCVRPMPAYSVPGMIDHF